MKLFVDTSVLVAAVVEQHEAHPTSLAILERVQNGKDEGTVSGHSLAEMYSVLTRAPHPYRHSPEQALLSIEENVVKYFEIVTLSGTEYASLVKEAASTGIQGGTIYDAVILRCALKSEAEKVYTLNSRHFQKLVPAGTAARIAAP